MNTDTKTISMELYTYGQESGKYVYLEDEDVVSFNDENNLIDKRTFMLNFRIKYPFKERKDLIYIQIKSIIFVNTHDNHYLIYKAKSKHPIVTFSVIKDLKSLITEIAAQHLYRQTGSVILRYNLKYKTNKPEYKTNISDGINIPAMRYIYEYNYPSEEEFERFFTISSR